MTETKSQRIAPSKAFGSSRVKKSTSLGNKNTVPLPKGAKTSKKRVGQGPGSGIGKTSARGQKGQKARTSSMRRGFEGGQMPLHRRLPKRGFTSKNHKLYQSVNIGLLGKLGINGTITPEILKQKNVIQDENLLIKILGDGEITVSIQITADAFSETAKTKIEKAGGTVTIRTQAKTNKD
ncbi:MAG: 50S ribosomal protein L15 [Leptospiraceae bacterium]|jgi:large subunit ribosomal protein L15|nr:50S ribosomal protein L15 [Leptospiraceae bacterium]MCZ8345571.1 50S ribosomal protein L15 [Leptospiraceae bacterium]PJE01943.1 MAG: 50S ribosomal protein L15 [Leptospira sp.]